MDSIYSQIDSTQNGSAVATGLGISFDKTSSLSKASIDDATKAKFGKLEIEGEHNKAAELPAAITDEQRQQFVDEIKEGRFSEDLEDAFEATTDRGLTGIKELSNQLNQGLRQTTSPNRIDVFARSNPRTGIGVARVYISDRPGGEPLGGKVVLLRWSTFYK